MSAQNVPEGPSRNRNAFYSLNSAWPLFLGSPKRHQSISLFCLLLSGVSLCCFLPRGSFRSAPGAAVAADCTPCPGGHHCPELGTVTPRPCGAGNFSVSSNPPLLPFMQHKAGFWHKGSSQGRLRLGVPRGRHWDELTSFHDGSGNLGWLRAEL